MFLWYGICFGLYDQYFGLVEDQVPLILIQKVNGEKYLKAHLEPDHIAPWVKEYKVIFCFLHLLLLFFNSDINFLCSYRIGEAK